jgi:hypothetical protein
LYFSEVYRWNIYVSRRNRLETYVMWNHCHRIHKVCLLHAVFRVCQAKMKKNLFYIVSTSRSIFYSSIQSPVSDMRPEIKKRNFIRRRCLKDRVGCPHHTQHRRSDVQEREVDFYIWTLRTILCFSSMTRLRDGRRSPNLPTEPALTKTEKRKVIVYLIPIYLRQILRFVCIISVLQCIKNWVIQPYKERKTMKIS